MSYRHLNAAFSAPVTGAAKSVLICIADRANENGFCYPSLRDIAERSGSSTRTVIRAVEKLETLGFIEKIKGKGRSNGYFFKFELSTENKPTYDTESPPSTYPQVTLCQKDVTQCHATSDTVTHKPSRTVRNHCAREDSLAKSSADKTEQAGGHLSFKPWQPPQTQRQINRKTGRGELKSIKQFLGRFEQ